MTVPTPGVQITPVPFVKLQFPPKVGAMCPPDVSMKKVAKRPKITSDETGVSMRIDNIAPNTRDKRKQTRKQHVSKKLARYSKGARARSVSPKGRPPSDNYRYRNAKRNIARVVSAPCPKAPRFACHRAPPWRTNLD